MDILVEKMKELFISLQFKHKLRNGKCVDLILSLRLASLLTYSLVRWLMLHMCREA